MSTEKQIRIQSKRDSQANWETNNPTLLPGELIAQFGTNGGNNAIYTVSAQTQYANKVLLGSSSISDLNYAGAAQSNGLRAFDASYVGQTSANGLNFHQADAIIVEYSNDGGETWLEYPTTDNLKRQLVTDTMNSYYVVGNIRDGTLLTTDDLLRITIMSDATGSVTSNTLYALFARWLFNVGYATTDVCYVTIEALPNSNNPTWKTLVTQQKIQGNSNWNSVYGQISLHPTYPWAYSQVRFTFGVTESNKNRPFYLIALQGICSTIWASNSFCKQGHKPYKMLADQTVQFLSEFPVTIKNLTNNKLDTLNNAISIDSINSNLSLFNTTDNTISSGTYYSFNLGKDNKVGQKAFYIKSIDTTNNKIYLSKTKIETPTISTTDYTDGDFETPEYAVGDYFSLIIRYLSNSRTHDHLRYKIAAIQNNVVTYECAYDLTFPYTEIYTDSQIKGNTFFVPSKPFIGSVDITMNGTATGEENIAAGENSFVEGCANIAAGNYAHAEGLSTQSSYASHAEGQLTKALGLYSHTEGNRTLTTGDSSHAEGYSTEARELYTHAEGFYTKASGQSAHSEGRYTEARNTNSHAEGLNSVAKADNAHAEGEATEAAGKDSHAEGRSTQATNYYAHAEGDNTKATGQDSHAEGYLTQASGMHAHTEGSTTEASGKQSHAEGYMTAAKGTSSHAEGHGTQAQGNYSHAEGDHTTAIGAASHAGGLGSIAREALSVAIGNRGITSYQGEVAIGYGDGVNNIVSVQPTEDAVVINHNATLCNEIGVSLIPQMYTTVLQASNWSNTEPYTYNWPDDELTTLTGFYFDQSFLSFRYNSNDISNMSAAYEAFCDAQMVGGDTTTELLCLGEKPTVDIPIKLLLFNTIEGWKDI